MDTSSQTSLTSQSNTKGAVGLLDLVQRPNARPDRPLRPLSASNNCFGCLRRSCAGLCFWSATSASRTALVSPFLFIGPLPLLLPLFGFLFFGHGTLGL